MSVILIVSSKKFVERNTLIFMDKGEKRPSLDAPAPRGFYLCRHQWVKEFQSYYQTYCMSHTKISSCHPSWCQWRSRIEGFCNSATTRNDVIIFLTSVSRPTKTSHPLASLSMPRISFANRLVSFSIVSTSIFDHKVVRQAFIDVRTMLFKSQTSFTRVTSRREAWNRLKKYSQEI